MLRDLKCHVKELGLCLEGSQGGVTSLFNKYIYLLGTYYMPDIFLSREYSGWQTQVPALLGLIF